MNAIQLAPHHYIVRANSTRRERGHRRPVGTTQQIDCPEAITSRPELPNATAVGSSTRDRCSRDGVPEAYGRIGAVGDDDLAPRNGADRHGAHLVGVTDVRLAGGGAACRVP